MNKLRVICLTLTIAVVGCETMGPALTSLAVAFGRDLIATTSANYAPRYALELEGLLLALTQQATGMQIQGGLAASGYQPPPLKYKQNTPPQSYPGQYGDPYGQPNGPYAQQNDPYAQQNDPYAQQNDPYAQQNDPYAQQNDPYAQQNDPYAQQNDPYAQQNDPYAQQNDPYAQQNDPYAQQNDPYAQQNDPYAQQNDPYAQQNDPYAQQNDPYAQPNAPYAQPSGPYAQPSGPYAQANNPYGYRVRGIAPIQLDVALMAQRAGTTTLVAVEDGESLVDGGGNPTSGDLLKVYFQTNCACYVYVIGVDATGYVAQIYPDPEEGHQNPVAPGGTYLIPQSGDDWWALDSYKGVEQVYFMASYQRREDIEKILTQMTSMPRALQSQNYQPVTQPAIIPNTRGLVKVKAKPVQVPASSGTQTVTPTLFTSQEPGADVVVTRWFRHE